MIAKNFAVYYDLFNKYRSDYQVEEILCGAQVYLDCAAAMLPDAGVLTYYSAMLKEFYVNQEAIHLLAYRGRQALADAGRRVSKVLTGAENHPVIWGGSATELFRLLADAPFFLFVSARYSIARMHWLEPSVEKTVRAEPKSEDAFSSLFRIIPSAS